VAASSEPTSGYASVSPGRIRLNPRHDADVEDNLGEEQELHRLHLELVEQPEAAAQPQP
jgi:hypothetical protein